MSEKQVRGRAGEDLACRHLQDHGLHLVERNFLCRLGELDLIMRDGDCLVFVEVRCRRSSRHGSPLETITHSKRQKLIRTARHYLQRLRREPPCRFDVVAITGTTGQEELLWIRDAFQT